MPLGFKNSAFVEAPLFAGWFQSTAASTQTSLPHPLSFLSRGGNNRSNTSAFRVGRLCSFSDAKRSLFRSHQNPPRKHKCHRRACSTRGVFAGSARHWITAVFRPLRGALRSNTPFKVRPLQSHIPILSSVLLTPCDCSPRTIRMAGNRLLCAQSEGRD